MYKKFTLTKGVGLPYARKIFLIMRLATILLTITIMQVSAASFAQKVSLNEKNADLKTIFTELRRQTGYDFICTEALFNTAKKVTIHTNGELKNVLDQVFSDQPLSFSVTDKTVVIAEKELNFIEKTKAYLAQVTIMAKVTDELGNPMVGVTVKIKDSDSAVTTDSKGNFTITVPNEQILLIFSYVGYETAELQAKSIINGSAIILKPNTTNLKEVVINKGYYQEKSYLSTGNVTKITAQDIDKQVISNPLQALQGRVPGLYIQALSGLPDAPYTVRLRGTNNLYGGKDPFYVVDGVPYQSSIPGMNLPQSTWLGSGSVNPLTFINPYDIESIEVLKDADATAIYGSRAANGAILITTKKGKIGKLTLSANMQTGISTISESDRVKMMDTHQYLEMRNEAFKNDGLTPGTGDYDLNGTWDQRRYTDWQKAYTGGVGRNTILGVNLSGGTTNTQYLFGINYSRQTTVFPTVTKGYSAVQKPNFHFNLNTSSADQKFKVSLTASYLVDINKAPAGIGSIAFLPPNSPPAYNPDGSLNWAPLQPGQPGTWQNPFAVLYTKNSTNVINLTSHADLTYNVLPGLIITAGLGYNKVAGNNYLASPTVANDPGYHASSGYSIFSNNSVSSWIAEPKLDFNQDFGKHHLSVTLGSTWSSINNNNTTLSASNFPNDALLTNPAAAATVRPPSATITQYLYNAIYSRIGYNYDERYIVNLTARRDGSNRFGSDRQFGNFGSIGMAWNFSKENFFKDISPFLSFGKLRGSYGITGNDQIGDYQYLDVYRPTGATYQGTKGLYPSSQYNTDLAWEVTKKAEAGIELGFFNDRVHAEISVFRNLSSNQFASIPTSYVTGFVDIPVNLPATVQNTGWEVMLNTINIKLKNFAWSTGFNISATRNKLLSYPNLQESYDSRNFFIGQSLNFQRVFRFAGVNTQDGLYQFYDSKGNLTHTPYYFTDTYNINMDPDFFGGINNSLRYKDFSLDAQISFGRQRMPNLMGIFGQQPGMMFNQPAAYLDRWQKPGDVTTYQKYSTQPTEEFSYATSSDMVYPKIFYAKLNSLSIAWHMPNRWSKLINVNYATIKLQGQNLITFSNYKDGDPETHSYLTPPLKIWSLGINVSL